MRSTALLVALLFTVSACGPGRARQVRHLPPSHYAVRLQCQEVAREEGNRVRIVQESGDVLIGRLDMVNCEGQGVIVVDVSVKSGQDSTAVLDLASLASVEVIGPQSNDLGVAFGAVLASTMIAVLIVGASLKDVFKGPE